MKLIGHPNTDNELTEKQFLATQRYSPQELFFRTEEDNENGWRAINLYQIGGVLHDLIMKKELFHGKSPYGNIVKAIQDEMPIITSDIYSDGLVNLTLLLLLKDPNIRLKLASLDRVNAYLINDDNEDSFEKELQKSKTSSDFHKVKLTEIERILKSNAEIIATKQKLKTELTKTTKDIIDEIKNSGMFKEYILGETFSLSNNNSKVLKNAIVNIPIRITAALDYSIPRNLYINFHLIIDETGLCSISVFAFFAGTEITEDLKDFDNMILQAINPGKIVPKKKIYFTGMSQQPIYELRRNFEQITLFEGIYSNDNAFRRTIKTQIAKLINKAIELTKKETEEELAQLKAIHEGNGNGVSFSRKKTIIISLK